MLLIKNAVIYTPDPQGVGDVLIGGGKILKIGTDLPVQEAYGVQVIHAEGRILFPGLIDSHVHVLGGGGEGGARTRTPEIMLTDITLGGVTTVAGLLGTDGCTRTMSNLLAKTQGLNEEGITAICYTGSYQVPVRTLTGSVMDDIILLHSVIGTGEIALSDHRSSQPTYEDFAKIVADTRVGGILSAKAGLVNIHMGDGKEQLSYLRRLAADTQIPPSNLLPTHINRNPSLFEDGVDYAKKLGGFIDFTTSFDPNHLSHGELRASQALKKALDAGVDIRHITFSSDGQGSLPVFDAEGNFAGLGVGKVTSVYREMRTAVLEEGLPLETVLKVATTNPATLLKLKEKGQIREDFDADLVLADPDTLEIQMVIAKGQIMVQDGKPVIKGTFE